MQDVRVSNESQLNTAGSSLNYGDKIYTNGGSDVYIWIPAESRL
jgi:hypothetical protein